MRKISAHGISGLLAMLNLSCLAFGLEATAAGPSIGGPGANEASEEPAARSAPVAARKTAATFDGPTKVYALVDAKHITNEYYAVDGRRLRSDPAVHGRFQLGVRLYGDKLDLSVAGGAVKLPASLAIYQRRPELLVDVYPIKGQYLNVLWYNMLQFPVREADRDPTEFMDSDLYEQDSTRGIDSTVYTVGLAPVVKNEWRGSAGKFLIRIGADGWTKMYSKPLFVDDTQSSTPEKIGLVKTGEEEVEKPFEDRALRYVHQESILVGWSPSFAGSASIDVGAYIESRYLPQYFRDESGQWDYSYLPERRSFWRAKFEYEFNQTFSFQDEVFIYRNGFFADNRVDDQRRFRNIVKLSAKL